MKTFSKIVLGIGIIMVLTFLATLVEYSSPGSITGAMRKIDGWIGWVRSAALLFAIVATGLGLLVYIVSKIIPWISDFLASEGTSIVQVVWGFAGTRAGIITLSVVGVLFLIGLALLAIWALSLFVF